MSCALLDLRSCRKSGFLVNPEAKPLMVNTQAKRKLPGQPGGIWQSRLPRKASKHKHKEIVPQTDTGIRVEKTKANE